MKKILVIDDEKSVRELLKMFFERNDYNVLSASDGKQGIKLYKENKVDLIITDIIMPEKEGLETIREFKSIDPDIKIIAISGGGNVDPETYLGLAKKMGALYTFSKPLDNKTLLSAVNTLLDQ
ncbi:MAG: response regulator [Desulfobacteraceae bacterium]|nr:response regulator [Desulfobacteraceae bacterium]